MYFLKCWQKFDVETPHESFGGAQRFVAPKDEAPEFVNVDIIERIGQDQEDVVYVVCSDDETYYCPGKANEVVASLEHRTNDGHPN